MPPSKMHQIGEEVSCKKCGEKFIITERKMRYGKYICGHCEYGAYKDWRLRNLEKARDASRLVKKRMPKEKRRALTRLYRLRHPDAVAAHQYVQTTLRSGKLSRELCSVCGDEKAHAHHDDYANPSYIIWLCHKHHMERHYLIAEDEEAKK